MLNNSNLQMKIGKILTHLLPSLFAFTVFNSIFLSQAQSLLEERKVFKRLHITTHWKQQENVSNHNACNSNLSFVPSIGPVVLFDAKTSTSPVQFILSKRYYEIGKAIRIQLVTTLGNYSKLPLIQRFFVQAHKDNTTEVVGEFNTSLSDFDISLLSCGNITQKDTVIEDQFTFRTRQIVTIYWIPPAHESFHEKIRFHANVRISANETWRGLSSFEVVPKRQECVVGNGSTYRGTAHTTASGIECQRWDSNKPHSHFTNPTQYPEAGLTSNFCRNSDNDSWPWCYTTDPDHRNRYEACQIPECSDNLPDFFYRFGVHEGDDTLLQNKSYSPMTQFMQPVKMKAINLTSFQVYENGLVVFNNASGLDPSLPAKFSSQVKSQPPMKDPTIIAPFWTKVNRTKTSTGTSLVFYQQSSDETLLLRATDDIKSLASKAYNTNYSIDSFQAKFALVVTWYLVNNNESLSTPNSGNVFQMVLAEDNEHTFVIFNYNMKNWTENVRAQVGYDVGNGQHTNVATIDVNTANNLSKYVAERSNVGTAGRWMLDVSPPCLCETNAKDPVPGSGDTTRPIHTSAKTFDRTEFQATLTTPLEFCKSNPCNNGGYCQPKPDGFVCKCVSGYTGTTCSLDINDCVGEPCLNGGTCVDQVNDFRCSCRTPYMGKRCEKRPVCSNKTCQNHGICEVEKRNGINCVCQPGYMGERCAVHICLDGHCSNATPCLVVRTGDNNCTCFGESAICLAKRPSETFSTIPTLGNVSCSAERIGSKFQGYIVWKETLSKNIAYARCPTPSDQLASRFCDGYFGWRPPNMSNCQKLSPTSILFQGLFLSSITAENASSIVSQLAKLTSQQPDSLTAFDVGNVASVLLRAVNVMVHLNQSSASNILGTISNVLLSSDKERALAGQLTSANVLMVTAIERTALKVKSSSANTTQVQSTSLNMIVANTPIPASGFLFSLSPLLVTTLGEFDDNHFQKVQASIVLPANIFQNSEYIGQSVQFVAYKNSRLFKFSRKAEIPGNPKKLVLSDQVISATLGNKTVQNLSESITITIAHNSTSKPYCVFWKPPMFFESEGYWSSNGCKTLQNGNQQTVCKCDHLTNFAVLLDIYQTQDTFPEIHNNLLRLFTYIGCGVSILGLVLTIISYALFGKLHKDVPSKILMSLCLALIFVNVLFLCGRVAFDNPVSCVTVAALLHYFLLCALMWMGLEALNMYIALIRVFNAYYRKYYMKLSIAGWGIPLIFVSVAIGTHFWLEPSYIHKPQHNICWLRPTILYGTLIGPFGVIFIFNCIIFFLVLGQLLGMSSRQKLSKRDSRRVKKPTKRENARKFRGAVGLLALLGIAWGLAFVEIGEASLTLSYAFVILNSTQGLWVFIFHCFLKADICKGWRQVFKSKTDFEPRSLSKQWTRQESGNSSVTTKGSRCTTTASRTQSTASIRALDCSENHCSDFDAKPSSDKENLDKKDSILTGVNRTRRFQSLPENTFAEVKQVFPTHTRLIRRIPRPVISPPSTSVAVQTEPTTPTKNKAHKSFSTGMNYGEKYRIISLKGVGMDRWSSSTPCTSIQPPQEAGLDAFCTHQTVSSSSSNESGVYSDNISGKSDCAFSEDKLFSGTYLSSGRNSASQQETMAKCIKENTLDGISIESTYSWTYSDQAEGECLEIQGPEQQNDEPEKAEKMWKPPIVIKRGDCPQPWANNKKVLHKPWKLTNKFRSCSQPDMGRNDVASFKERRSPSFSGKHEGIPLGENQVERALNTQNSVKCNAVDNRPNPTVAPLENKMIDIQLNTSNDSIKMIKFRINRGSFHDTCS